jgi:hypothetical protein
MKREEMNAWLKSMTDRIERGPRASDQNRFRLLAKTNLQIALGPSSKFDGRTIAEVLDESEAGVTTPGFVPTYDPALRALDWPDGV